MSRFAAGHDDQDDETWQAEHATESLPAPVDNRSLFERLQEQKAAKEDALNEATKFSNLIRRLDNDELDFLAHVSEQKEREKEAQVRETQAALRQFRDAQRVVDNALARGGGARIETTHVVVSGQKRNRLSVSGVLVKRAKKSKKQEQGSDVDGRNIVDLHAQSLAESPEVSKLEGESGIDSKDSKDPVTKDASAVERDTKAPSRAPLIAYGSDSD